MINASVRCVFICIRVSIKQPHMGKKWSPLAAFILFRPHQQTTPLSLTALFFRKTMAAREVCRCCREWVSHGDAVLGFCGCWLCLGCYKKVPLNPAGVIGLCGHTHFRASFARHGLRAKNMLQFAKRPGARRGRGAVQPGAASNSAHSKPAQRGCRTTWLSHALLVFLRQFYTHNPHRVPAGVSRCLLRARMLVPRAQLHTSNVGPLLSWRHFDTGFAHKLQNANTRMDAINDMLTSEEAAVWRT